MVKLAMVCQVPVAGSHISASYAGSLENWFTLSTLLDPPVTNTFPSGSSVALWSLRPPFIDPVYVQLGVGLLRSLISAVAVGRVQFATYVPQVVPPINNTFPASYIRDSPELRELK